MVFLRQRSFGEEERRREGKGKGEGGALLYPLKGEADEAESRR